MTARMTIMAKHQAATLLATATLAVFAFLGSRGLIGTSEGRYAACAQEMIALGDYGHPTLNGEPHWSKPPLTYWAIAGGVKLFGYNEWGVRVINALALVATVWLIAPLGRRLGGPRTGWLAGMIYATAPATVLAAWVMTTDTLLTLWMTLAVFCWVAAAQAPDRIRTTGWMAACGAALGLGFMTKGPPALLALFAAAAWPIRPARRAWPGGGLALLAFAATGLTWYIGVCFEHPDLLHYFLGEEIAHRFRPPASTPGAHIKVHNHHWYKSFTVYGPLLVAGLGLWMIPVTRALWSRRRDGCAAWRTDPRLRFLLIWIVGSLAVLSLSSSKLPLYALPLFTPLTLGAALLLAADADSPPRPPYHLRKIGWLSLALVILVKGVISHLPLHHDMRQLYQVCREQAPHGRIAIFDQRRYYGLQFYLRGHLERVCHEPIPDWADTTLTNWLNEVERESERAVIMEVNTNNPLRVVSALDERFAVQRIRLPQDRRTTATLYVLQPRSHEP